MDIKRMLELADRAKRNPRYNCAPIYFVDEAVVSALFNMPEQRVQATGRQEAGFASVAAVAPQCARAERSLRVLSACLPLLSTAAAQGLSPDQWFYEIDGDYGSIIDDTISDGGVTTESARENCGGWVHTDLAPYMGRRAYSVGCLFSPDITLRSEQHFLQGWRAGEDSARFLSFAVRLRHVSEAWMGPGGGWIAQLHGNGLPFNLVWVAEPDAGYSLWAGAKYDEQQEIGTFETRQPYLNLGRIEPDRWTRVLIHIDLSKGTGKCPNAINNAAFWSVALMDNATGLWGEPVRYDGQMGNPFFELSEGDSFKCDGLTYNFKIGQYVVATTHSLDYDNISYGKRWINITKNHLIGYQKSVLRLSFEEPTASRRVEDRSYTWNGGAKGDPVSDYDNDGAIMGRVTRVPDGVKGRALRFPGKSGPDMPDSYVRVPINADTLDDFDVGNYMTVSAWFRTKSTPPDNKGLVMIDEFSDTWKLLLYMRGDGIAFGVGHPGAYSRLDLAFPRGRYADNEWHLVTGTYNRFAPDGQRIKLYIDGEKVMEGAGSELPILRGDNQLVVGKYSVDGFFQGDIDDVGLFNYAMTDAQVASLWLRPGEP